MRPLIQKNYWSLFQKRTSFFFSDSKKESSQQRDEKDQIVEEIMRSQNKDISEIKVKSPEQRKLDLENYEILKRGQYYDGRLNKRNPDFFNFIDDRLFPSKDLLQVIKMKNRYFSVNGVWYPGSIMILANQVLIWDVNEAEDIKAHSLDILEVIKPRPQHIVIGTGKEKYHIHDSVYSRFVSNGIKVEILPTFEACSTFNVCTEDGINTAAFLIPESF